MDDQNLSPGPPEGGTPNGPAAPAVTAPPEPTPGQSPAPDSSNDLFPTPEPAPENPVAQKIESSTRGLFEKIGWKRGRGRPRNDGSPKISDVPLGPGPLADSPGQAADSPAPVRPVDSNLVKKCVAAIGKSIAGIFDRSLESKAVAVTQDREFARALVKETTATPTELDALGEVTDILLKQLGVDTRHLPLICACTIVAGAGARYAVAFKSLNAQLAEKVRRERASAAQPKP